jgi:hypothetical protein
MEKSILLEEIEKWSQKYELSFQFWGNGCNNVFISKDGVDLYDAGGYSSIEDVLTVALKWIYRVNRTPMNKRIC